MNTAPPKIGRPLVLGIAVAAAAVSLIAACLGLMAVASRAPGPSLAAHSAAD